MVLTVTDTNVPADDNIYNIQTNTTQKNFSADPSRNTVTPITHRYPADTN